MGSIPACAGEPALGDLPILLGGVYPRVCGGTVVISILLALAEGLSPRVRGNRTIHYYPGDKKRSIPACAGEPPLRLPRQQRHRVYPRVCGGTWYSDTANYPDTGLSPRVRGNR